MHQNACRKIYYHIPKNLFLSSQPIKNKMTDGRKSRPRITPSAGTIHCTIEAYPQMIVMYNGMAIVRISITPVQAKLSF